MANPQHLEVLMQGAENWNRWRASQPQFIPDFEGAVLTPTKSTYDKLAGLNLIGADLRESALTGADLRGANLTAANLSGADLKGANLVYANLTDANLDRANLSYANLGCAKLIKTRLSGTNFRNATTWYTVFGDNDLSSALDLETAYHQSPSTIGLDTIYKSNGKIPLEFLQGCGIPEQFIALLPSLINSIEPFQFHSCFISYSTKDEEFAKRLHSRLRDAKVRVWFAPEDIQGGKKLYDQLEHAIQVHERLLLVLSEHSIRSNWVQTEIRRAIETEKREGRRKLFPIRLTDYDTLRQWRCFDADSGRDMAIEIREYFIPDFSNWKDHDSFEKGFDRLLRDLKAEEEK